MSMNIYLGINTSARAQALTEACHRSACTNSDVIEVHAADSALT